MANSRRRYSSSSSSSSSLVEDEHDRPRASNLGIRDEPDHSKGRDPVNTESNPFSFKRFLKKDTQTNYKLAGARPKVYYTPKRTSPEPSNSLETDGVYPRNPTELPDFVQDHLVIEQCFLNHDAAAPVVADIDNLPDFALNSVEQRQSQSHWIKGENSEATGDLPFDLTGGLDRRNRQDRFTPGSSNLGSTDLPNFNRTNTIPPPHQQQFEALRRIQGFPFDLPDPTSEPLVTNASGPTNSPANEPSVTKSLPDFLNDGPIHNRVGGPPAETSSTPDLPERSDRSLLLENERLREELKFARRHIAERTRMIESLQTELASRRAADHEETAHLEKAMEQVEVNLKRSTKRATNAESAVTLLKQEVKALTAEIATLRSENRELRDIAGAGCADFRMPGSERRIKRLSDELRAAATTAEGSLRQLMSGVNNLRVLASALENADRIEDRTKDFLPDFEEDNAAGPAL